MKRSKYHIITSWVLLICFIAGQYMVYAHQHKINNVNTVTHSIAKNIHQQTISEKCALCDVMHHNTMVTNSHVYFNVAAVTGHVFKSFEYSFISIQLILSGGRAPPMSNHLV